MKNFILILFICTSINGQILWNDQGYIPQGYQEEWTKAGLLFNTPQFADFVYTITDYGAIKDDGNDEYGAIMSAVESAKSKSVK